MSTPEVVWRVHYHDNDGLPDQLEVVEAPPYTAISAQALMTTGARWRLWWGDTLVFGTPGLGVGRVAYRITEWRPGFRDLIAVRILAELPCCDVHTTTCEPPSELCCHQCTEIAHGWLGEHTDGSPCVLEQDPTPWR